MKYSTTERAVRIMCLSKKYSALFDGRIHGSRSKSRGEGWPTLDYISANIINMGYIQMLSSVNGVAEASCASWHMIERFISGQTFPFTSFQQRRDYFVEGLFFHRFILFVGIYLDFFVCCYSEKSNEKWHIWCIYKV